MKHLKIAALLLFLVFLSGLGGYFISEHRSNYFEAKKNKIALEKRKASWLELKQTMTDEINQFNGEAGVIVKDLDMDWEIAFNKEKPFPSASLTKIPIMAACFGAAEDGRLKLNESIKLKSTDKLTGSGALKSMAANSEFTVEELIGRMIYDSDNTATNMLTNLFGLEYFNGVFKSFGLKNTNLSRRIADYRARDRGIENYTTAGDMSLLLEKMYRRKLVSKSVSEKCLMLMKLQRSSDRIPKYLPVDLIISHKTGLEKGICHDVGIVFTKEGNFIICVLTKHANLSSAISKEFIAKIARHAYFYFEKS